MYKAITIANWFIARANKEDVEGESEGITPLKLQKIIYLAQAAHLALDKGPLFNEDILAWKYGPVVAEVYAQFKNQKAPISEPLSTDYLKIEEKETAFLEEVWGMFGKFTAFKLVELTHEHRPWKDAQRDSVITQEVIKDYYSGIFIEEGDGE